LFDDFFAEITDAKDNVGEAGFLEQADLVGEKRFARDLDEEFGDFFGNRAESGREASGEEGDGELGCVGHRF
jgi:hypothetical protein